MPDNIITDNLKAIIVSLVSKSKNNKIELDTNKIISFIKEKYDIDISEDTLQKILSEIPNVDEVISDKIIAKTDVNLPVKDEIDVADKSVETMAKKAATKDLTDAFNVLNKIKIGNYYPADKFKLLEEDEDYYIHLGAKKTKSKYYIQKITESEIWCKLSNGLTIKFPVQRVV